MFDVQKVDGDGEGTSAIGPDGEVSSTGAHLHSEVDKISVFEMM